MPNPLPLRPDPHAQRDATLRALTKAAIKQTVAALETRGGVPPLTLTSAPNAVRSMVADTLAALTTVSAGAALLEQGLQLQFANHAAILVPQFAAASAANVGWVGEGGAIPVRQLDVDGGPTLEPRKLAVLTALSREMIEGSNAEALVRDTLTASATLALDEALLDATAGDAVRPAGLRHGIAASTASAATDAQSAMVEDVSTLASAVAAVAGSNGAIAFIADPAHAMTLKLRLPPGTPITALASSAASMAGIVMAVAGAALVSAVGSVRIESSRDAVLHFDDVPLPIGTPGSPATVAAPVRSIYQTDCVSLRLILEASWALRDSRGCAWLTPSW